MATINDYLKYDLRRARQRYGEKNVLVELDPNMPDIYVDKFPLTGESIAISNMLDQTLGELITAEPNKIRIKTKYEAREGLQYFTIEHDGNKVPEDALERIRGTIDLIEQGGHDPLLRGGHQIAAGDIFYLGGKVRLENLTNSEYSVKTTVTLPDIKPPLE